VDIGHSRNFCTSASDPRELNDESIYQIGHGTGCASLVGGKNIGVAPQVLLTNTKVCNAFDEVWEDDVVSAFNYIRDNWQLFDIVNCSFGWAQGGLSAYSLQRLEQAVNEVILDRGIPVICAAGNTGIEQYFNPASFANVIACGAIDIQKKAASFTTMNDQIDLCQVGIDVPMAALDGKYRIADGTSYATPIVTGIASLLLCRHKERYHERMPEAELYNQLMGYTVDVDIAGLDKKTGAGLCTLENGIHVKLKPNDVNYTVNGQAKIMDAPPVVVKDRIELPGRLVVESIGGEIFANQDGSIEYYA
jgi:major intracellular serine protease